MGSKYHDKHYMSICSEKTLQSNNKGFFMSFVDRVAEVVGEKWIISVFGNLKTDRERIKCIFENGAVSSVFLTFAYFSCARAKSDIL